MAKPTRFKSRQARRAEAAPKNRIAGPAARMETGAVQKSWTGRIAIALVYPSTYHVGMSNLGFQTVYKLLSGCDDLVCERVFQPEGDGGHSNAVPLSVESGRRLTDFHVIAFSISFESDYLNLLALLAGAGIPLRSDQRDARHPLVMAGGIAPTLNPEPIAPFMDCILIGEGEMLLPAFFESFDPFGDRTAWLRMQARGMDGVYLPACYAERYTDDGYPLPCRPLHDLPERVARVYQADLSATDTCSVLTTPDTTFGSTVLVETGRGCPHGCRFCSAGFIYRPPRFRPAPALAQAMGRAAEREGRIGLMGAAVSDLPDLESLCAGFAESAVSISFSSLRADAMSDSLIRTLKKSGVKTATLAPDAGSERMRRVINKGITEEHILDAAERLVAAGIPNLKLYFMIGLPTEDQSDVEAVVGLCRRIKHQFLRSSRARGRMGEITLSLNSFVPKPVTPFQWAAMDAVAALKQKIKWIRKEVRRIPNLRLHSDVPRHAYLQALFARGDRRTARFLVDALASGGNWAQTLKRSSLNADFYVARERGAGEWFPWEVIDSGVARDYLWQEYQRGLKGKASPPCPMVSGCDRCGACSADSGASEP